MLDTNSYTFKYLTDEEQPYYLEVTFHNSTVVTGFAPGDVGDMAAFEVTDKLTGEQLACINIGHLDMVNEWHSIVTKAHHLVLDLHAKAVEQAKRDKQWAELLAKATERFENIDRYLGSMSELLDSRNVTDEDIRNIHSVVDSLTNAGHKLDLIDDPEEL